MKIIVSENPDQALLAGLLHLEANGIRSESRNGTVVVSPTPVVTVNTKPRQRVMFNARRDANPFFHLFESIWMLAGRNDVAFPAMYAKQLELYSDDGETLNGAYGYRWRQHFDYDQLELIIEELTTNPTSRRCVLAMWDGQLDLESATTGSKDVPCNTHIYFNVQPGDQGPVDMTVCCRSNDAVWGAHGANVVHFSFLLEYVAQSIGRPVGYMYQYSNNYHIYADRPDVARLGEGAGFVADNRYGSGAVVPTTLGVIRHLDNVGVYASARVMRRAWRVAANALIDDALSTNEARLKMGRPDPFLNLVVRPLMLAHLAYKSGSYQTALEYVADVREVAPDWAAACAEWVTRRVDKKGAAA